MGTGTSKSSQISPVVATISVRPAVVEREHSESSGGSTLKKTSRSSSDNRSGLSTPAAAAGQRVLGSARHTGGTSRPLSTVSGRQRSGRGHRLHTGSRGGNERLKSGLPYQRELDSYDLNSSMRSQRVRTVGQLFQGMHSPENDVIFLRMDPDQTTLYPPSCCQLCGNQFTNLGIRAPLLLLCGHSYCSSCLEKACNSCDYPTALKCGICSIITPLDQPNPDDLPENKSILNLVSSKEYTNMISKKHPEPCAECVHKTATTYCSECSASYCDHCGDLAHEGSRVRARHKPVPINLKPRPQPTCKKHSGQSCVLYCETDKQPMCVLCKFYNEHRFHKFELLSKVASNYTRSITKDLEALEEQEKKLGEASQSLYAAVNDINSSAKRVQEKLEKHFCEMRKSYLAALERREAMLLSLVDRQVDIKQEILAELRLEVAAARARVLTAQEEASRSLLLNPITALLMRRHLDLNLERALKQTITTPLPPMQPDVTLTLLPDIVPSQVQTVSQHGAVLQLPPQPQFTSVILTTNTISLEWELEGQNNVCSDRTMSFSLHCYGDIPNKFKTRLTFSKSTTNKIVTPESGFEDMSELSSESKNTFPSLPSVGSRMDQLKATINEEPCESTEDLKLPALLKPISKDVTSQLPEPIRLPKMKNDPTGLPPLSDSQQMKPIKSSSTGGKGVLNLPPLVVDKVQQQEGSIQSITTSGVFGDSEGNSPHMSTIDESEQTNPTTSTSSLSLTSTGSRGIDYTKLGRFCEGYAFEEIYSGKEEGYLYSGAVAGASYYFRVRCHNAAGLGPWSDTVHCTTPSLANRSALP